MAQWHECIYFSWKKKKQHANETWLNSGSCPYFRWEEFKASDTFRIMYMGTLYFFLKIKEFLYITFENSEAHWSYELEAY